MIIDALTHLSHDGRWFATHHDASEATLLDQMERTGVNRAVVVGLDGVISDAFVSTVCARHRDRLLPVASFNPAAFQGPGEVARPARERLRDRGFVGVKLHPRLNRYDPLDPRVLAFLDEVATWKPPLPIWICTYLHYPGGTLRKAPAETFQELAGHHPGLPFVLAHGGGPDLLRVAHAVRTCRNVLLDLSYTMTKFAGSSLDQDIRFLLHTFADRLVLGSDFPEIGLPQARLDFERLAGDLPERERQAVLGANLARVLGLDPAGSEGG